MTSPLLIAALTVGVMVLGIWLGRRISPNSRARRGGASVAKDDALKHIFVFRERGLEAMPESFAGGLGLPLRAVGDLARGLERSGWFLLQAGRLSLSAAGEQRVE